MKEDELFLPSEGDPLDGPPAASAKPAFPKQRRRRSTETFARIPHDQAAAMRDIGGIGWLLVIEIDRQILKGRGRNPVRLTNYRMHQLGISRQSKRYYLRQLEAAGIVKVQAEARKWTIVTLLWFPVQT